MAQSTKQIFEARITGVEVGESTAGTVRYSAIGTGVTRGDSNIRVTNFLPERPLPPDFEIVPLQINDPILVIQDGEKLSMVFVKQEKYVFEECQP